MSDYGGEGTPIRWNRRLIRQMEMREEGGRGLTGAGGGVGADKASSE